MLLPRSSPGGGIEVGPEFRTPPTRYIHTPGFRKDTTYSLFDALDPAATQDFLSDVHEQYKEYIGGEFGRTVYSQGALTKENYGRDHHPRNFTMWLAGGGIKPGIVHGETDDFSYNVVDKPVHIHDLNATILHCLGIDHRRLTYRVQGLDMRLTGVEEHAPVADILL